MTLSSPKTTISENNSLIRPFFTLFILSRASDNTTCLNIGGPMHGPSPTSNFGGTIPQVSAPASSSISYSGLPPWPEGVCLALLRPICNVFAVPPWVPEVAVPSALWNEGPHCPFCSYFHKADPCIIDGWPYRVEWTSVGDCSSGFILTHSTPA